MARQDTDRNPNCEFAVTLADLKDPRNYHTMHIGTDHVWSPFLIINEDDKAIQRDAFLLASEPVDGTGWWTWDGMEDMHNSHEADLRSMGVIPWEDGRWSGTFCVFNSDAHKMIQLIWES